MVMNKAVRRISGGLAMLVLAGGLAGCNDVAGGLQADNSQRAPRIQARPGVSPAAATLAVFSVDGPPAVIAQKFDAQLQSAAATRDVVMAEPAKAHYLARGYLNAYPIDGGAAIAVVWDVFDGQKRRLQRVEDAIVLKGSAQDPWGLVDDRAVQALAARSAEDIAAFLTNTPEAMASGAVARATPGGPFPAAAPPARALSFSPVR